MGPALDPSDLSDIAATIWRFGADDLPATPARVVDVWAYDASLTRVLLVRHRDRGWVMPGGQVEAGETMRAAAVRELFEETGISVVAETLVAAAAHVGPEKVGLSYHAVLDDTAPLTAESADEPVAWWSLDDVWDSVYPHDRGRLVAHAQRLRERDGSNSPHF